MWFSQIFFHFVFCSRKKLIHRVHSLMQASLSRPKNTFGLMLQNIPHTTLICRSTRRENLLNPLVMVRIYLSLSLLPPSLPPSLLPSLRHPPAEFPSHSKKAKEDIQNGMVFAFTEDQIDQIIARYRYLTGVCFFFYFHHTPPSFSFILYFFSLSQNYYDLCDFF